MKNLPWGSKAECDTAANGLVLQKATSRLVYQYATLPACRTTCMTFEVGNYVIDLSSEGLGEQLRQSAASGYVDFFEVYGYLLLKLWPLWILGALWVAYTAFLTYKQGKFAKSITYDLIAVRVPPENEKTPMAMEQIMTALMTTESGPNFWEKWYVGEFQLSFSFEVVGINGQVRFLFRVPQKLRPIFEAYVYAQYPDAELQDVEDYVDFAPDRYPGPYKVYGADIAFTKDDAYPIKTYPYFRDRDGEGKYNYIDPLASFIEALGMMAPGEQLWMQLVCQPTGTDAMRKQGLALVDEMMGRKKNKPYKSAVMGQLVKGVHLATDSTLGAIMEGTPEEVGLDDAQEEDELPFMSPGEREVLKAVEENIAQPGFFVKMRMVYVAKSEIFNKAKFGAAFGGLLALNTQNLNGFRLDGKTKAKRDYAKWRIPRLQRKLVLNYKWRDMYAGADPFIMSARELATVFHFPYITTSTPSLERAATRAAQPPPDLPFELPPDSLS